MSILDEILSRVTITSVAQALGVTVRHGRCVAAWRPRANGWNVSLDDSKGAWFDHARAEGGGVVDFVTRIRGCDRREALRWLAVYAGVPLDDKPVSPEDRKRWVRERADLERIRREAAYFADAAAVLAEWALEDLSPTDPQRAVHTALLAQLRVAPEVEFRSWLKHQPQLAAALVHAGRKRAKRLQVLLARYLMTEVSNAA